MITNNKICQIGIIAVCRDTYMQPKRRGSNYFVKSPVSVDKTWSLCLYPRTGTFCDFSNGNKGGDCIGFVAYTHNLTNWEALKLLRDLYGLPDSNKESRDEVQRKIGLQQAEERQMKERRREFEAALIACICDIKHDAKIYGAAIGKDGFEPFSDEWCYCVNELQKTEYKLDILTGADCKAYSRMKAYHENLSSDRYQWLLDCLAVLAEGGAFIATEEELKEITAQRNFELTGEPGAAVRRCKIEW